MEASAAAECTATESAAPESAVAETVTDTKIPANEAAKAARLAQELGIQLPQGRGLTRQWIEFLNQMAAGK